jgi:GNAT superfamily N-acetyltransferase
MAVTEQPAIVRLDASDAASGLALSTEAHWNQNAADWQFFLREGIVFGMRDGDGRLIATAALLLHTASDAWISMVLVTESWRRRGLATRLINYVLATAAELKVVPRLDATPAGTAVYGPLGFRPTLELRRLRLQGRQEKKPAAKLAVCDAEEFIARDRAAIGFDRGKLLNELSGRTGSALVSSADAMALVRDGRSARHAGPLFAPNAARALALVDDIAAQAAGPLLIDAVASQQQFLAGLVQRGWNVERPFQRMRFGVPATAGEALPFAFAVAGPEYG